MRRYFLVIMTMLLSAYSCEFFVDHVYSIKIQNNSKDTIQFYESYSYPDVSIISEKPRLKMVYPAKYSYLGACRTLKYTGYILS
jgi:hypothetical protein